MAGPWERYQQAEDQPKKKTWRDIPQMAADDVSQVIQNIWGAAKGGAQAFKDVAEGKMSPTSDEAIGRMTDAASLAVGGGTRFAKGRVFARMPEAPAEATAQFSKPRGAIPENLSPEGEAHVAAFGEQAQQQGMSGAQRIAQGFDPQGKMRAGTAEEGGALMAHGLRRAAERQQQGIGDQFKFSTADFGEKAKPASIHADVVMGMPMQVTRDLEANRIQLINTPQSNLAIKEINTRINAMTADNRGVPGSGFVTNVNLATFDQMKQMLNRRRLIAARSGSDADATAMHKIIESVDKQIDGWVNSKKFSGDQTKVQAWNVARARENIYRNHFESGARTPYGEVIEKIIGDNKHAKGVGQRAADYATGSVGVNPPGYNASVVGGIKAALGADSPEWVGMQQSTFLNLVKPVEGAWEPRGVKTRILDFLDGKGRETANAMYSPQQRGVMRQYANDVQGMLDIIRRQPGGAEVAAKVMQWGVGEMLRPLGIVGKYTHMGVDHTTARAAQTRELRDLQAKLPLVKKALQSWFNEIERVQKNNRGNPREARQKQYAATATLSAALRRLGVGGLRNQPGQQGQDKLSPERAFGGPQF